MKKVKVGVIGAGSVGKMHAENLINNIRSVKVKSIADVYADSIKDWAHGIVIKNIYVDYYDILNDPEIDVVLICSSTNTHSSITIE